MLYKFPVLDSHQAFRVNRNLLYFFVKLRDINEHSALQPFPQYFDNQFSQFLNDGRQATLRAHFQSFFDAFKGLTTGERQFVVSQYCNAQKIDTIFEDITLNGHELRISALPIAIQPTIKALFDYLYSNTINSFGKLKDHYKEVFKSLSSTICPFCGIEVLNAPSLFRQDYDHMLKDSQYVFSSVNMDNLVPSGTECNRTYKHDFDVIYFGNTRSRFNSPYKRDFQIRISLVGSQPPTTMNGNGHWVVTINPDNDYTQQWDRVYKIKRRFIENFLNKFYANWLKEFRDALRLDGNLPIAIADLHDELISKGLVMQENPLCSQSNIIKGAFYDFIGHYADATYQAGLLEFMNADN